MREKLESLPVTKLREFAKDQGIRGCSSMRKEQLINSLMEIYDREMAKKETENSEKPGPAKKAESSENPEQTEKAESSEKPARQRSRNLSRRSAENQGRRNAGNDGAADSRRQNKAAAPVQSQETSQSQPQEQPREAPKTMNDLDSGLTAAGILEVLPDGYGFIRSDGYESGDDDIYVAPSQIRRFNLKTGDLISGNKRLKAAGEKFSALLFVNTVNGEKASQRVKPVQFENLTPVFPHERLHLETSASDVSMRIVDLLSPIGKGQRGMIVAQPKVGKTTLLKKTARALLENHPELHLIVLLIDERPEEVTDMRESITGPNVEVVYSTFDELPEHHKHVSEMVIERAKRLVELKKDVVILLDSITRLTRAYNITVTPSGRTLSGGLDPAALYMPKRFFGAARCMREGGSLTILATALLDTGSRLDDMVYEEFKGTGNMELVLNRKLSERNIFPAIDILRSSTRRDDLLLRDEEQAAVKLIRKVTASERKAEDATEKILDLFASTKSNAEFIGKIKYISFF